MPRTILWRGAARSVVRVVGDVAPNVQSGPTISGSTVGTILSSSNGSATGSPAPTPTIEWRRNGVVLAGETALTLDTTGFSAGDVIERRTFWTNTAGTGSFGPAIVTLTDAQVLSAIPSPNPIVANEPFTLTFNTPLTEAPSSSVPLTGSGTTWSGTAPASGSVAVDATKADWLPFSASYVVDTAVITPTAPITPAAMYETQTLADIPNFATMNATSYFTRAGRTIASVQPMVGQMVSPGAGQPAVLSNLENATGATVLNENDVVILRVTDSGGTVKDFVLADVQYMVNVTQVGGEILIDINDLVPAGEVFPYTDGFGTINLTRAMMSDGEENYVLPTLALDEETNELTGTPGKWLYNSDMAVPSKAHTLLEDGSTIHTFAPGDPLTYTGTPGKAYILVENVGGSTAQSAAINVPSAGPVTDTFTGTNGTKLTDYVGESGLGWIPLAGSESQKGFASLRNGRLAPNGPYNNNVIARNDPVMSDMFAEADVLVGTGTANNSFTNVAVRVQSTEKTGYFFRYQASNWHGMYRVVSGTETIIQATFIPTAERPAPGATAKFRLEVQGSTLRLYMNGALKWTYTDPSPLAAGRPGIAVNGALSDADPAEITNFTAGPLA